MRSTTFVSSARNARKACSGLSDEKEGPCGRAMARVRRAAGQRASLVHRYGSIIWSGGAEPPFRYVLEYVHDVDAMDRRVNDTDGKTTCSAYKLPCVMSIRTSTQAAHTMNNRFSLSVFIEPISCQMLRCVR